MFDFLVKICNNILSLTKKEVSTEKNYNSNLSVAKFLTRTAEGREYNLIKRFEGFKSKAYQCSARVWTVGYGTTVYHNNIRVKKGDSITKEQANFELKYYCENKINLSDLGNLSSNQKEALCSLIYNIGQSAFNRSTVKKRLLVGDSKERISEAWKRYNKADGKTNKGLVRRRNEEVKHYFKGEE